MGTTIAATLALWIAIGTGWKGTHFKVAYVAGCLGGSESSTGSMDPEKAVMKTKPNSSRVAICGFEFGKSANWYLERLPGCG